MGDGQDSGEHAFTCEECGQGMELVRVTPRFGALPELQTFRCAACGNVTTEIVEAD